MIAASRGFDPRTNYDTARLGVHHEFSSLIWQRQPATAIRWRALMPPGWQPAGSSAEALGAYERAPPPPASGILTAYGATSLENDFNTYAEIALAEPDRMKRLAAGNAVVAAKLAVLVDAYVATAPGFRQMFAALGYDLPPIHRPTP